MQLATQNVAVCLALLTGCVIDTGVHESDASSDDASSDDASSDDASSDDASHDDDGTETADPSVDESGDTTGANETGEVPMGCEALVGDGLTVHDGDIVDETWPAGRHRVQGWLTVRGRLEIQPCAIVEIDPGVSLSVRDSGALHMEGTADHPILVTSAKAAPAPGDWGAIEIYASSADGDNVLRHVTVEYAGASGYGAIWIESGASVAITDAVLRDSVDVAIDAENGAELREFVGNELVDNEGGAIRIGANQVDQLGAGVYAPNGVDGVLIQHDDVDHDAQWLPLGVPYVADDGFRIATTSGSANLTLTAGTTLQLGPAAILAVADKAGLHLAGTADARVSVISAKTPAAAGDWAQIEFYAVSNGPANVLEHVDVRHGGGQGYGQIWLDTAALVTLDDVVIEMSGGGCDIDSNGTVNATATTWVDCP